MFKLSKKLNEKWWTYGNVQENKFGKMQASFKKTPELVALINETPDGGWINFAAFEDKPREQTNHDVQKSNGYQAEPLDDSLPF
jgi:hypothetical protein